MTPPSGALSIPHSATFMDLDGDCMPDMYLTKTFTDTDSTVKTQYEIYIQKKFNNKQMYCYVQSDNFGSLKTSVEQTIPLVSFADMDRDGMVDIVFFKDSAVHTIYNKYSANGASETNLCK